LAGLALGAPAAAIAATPGSSLLPSASPTGPLSPGLPQAPATVPTATTPTVAPTTTPSTDSGLSGTGAIGIALGAFIVLGGIAVYIWRDARKRAPVKATPMAAGGARAGSKQKPKPRKPSPAERKRRKRGRAR
jgi:hypothetical protein